jgi:hypothetical protein
MTTRQLRRAAERKARKQARKAGLETPNQVIEDLSTATETEIETGTEAKPVRAYTGPTSPEGKAVSCLNNLRHGLTGMFRVLPAEDGERYQQLLDGLRDEHQPSTVTEHMLVEKMAQHFWLSQRAQMLADLSVDAENAAAVQDKQFALFLRYQTTNDRAFHKCLDQLLKLRAEKRKEVGQFESQKQRQAAEAQKQEAHATRVRLANARAEHLELDTDIRQYIQARIPGHAAIPFDRLKHVLAMSLETVFGTRQPLTQSAA